MNLYLTLPLQYQATESGNILAIHEYTGESFTLDFTEAAVLQLLDVSRTNHDLEAELIQRGWDGYGIKELPSILQALERKKLIFNPVAALKDIKNQTEQPVPLSYLGWPTKNRPDILRRGILSWIEAIRLSEYTPDLIVSDESDTSQRELVSNYVQEMSSIFTGKMYLINSYNKHKLIDLYPERMKESVHFALTPNDAYEIHDNHYGVTRNTLFLLGAGHTLAMVDDDIMAENRIISPFSEEIIIQNESKAFDIIPLNQYTHEGLPWKRDPLYYQNNLLGADISFFTQKETADFQYISSKKMHLSQKNRSSVRSFCFGAFGDAGMENTVYMLISRDLLKQAIFSHEDYENLRNSRQLFRGRNSLSIGGKEFFGMHTGFDFRDILPPQSPYGRSEDALWPDMLEILHPGALIAHPPLSLHHIPQEIRKNRTVTADPQRIGINESLQIICHFISSPGLGDHPYEEFGNKLMDFSLSKQFCGKVSMLTAQRYMSKQQKLKQQLEIFGGEPINWAEDVQKLIDSLDYSMSLDGFWLPFQFRYSEKQFRDYLFSFGKLLQDWPEIFAFMKENRDEILNEFRIS